MKNRNYSGSMGNKSSDYTTKQTGTFSHGDYGHKSKKGFVGYSTEGPNEYYFSEKFPRDTKENLDAFNPDMYDILQKLRHGNKIDQSLINQSETFLRNIDYIDYDENKGKLNRELLGASKRYVLNYTNHPDNTAAGKIMRHLKSLF